MNCVERWGNKEFIVTDELINRMNDNAKNNIEGKFRYCLHENDEAPIHQMIFTNKKELYSRPHWHNHDEFQIVVDGQMYVVFFDEKGSVSRSFFADKMTNSIYRIETGIVHCNIPVSDTVTIMEFKPGPFTVESNRYPLWAPLPEEVEEAEHFQQRILEQVVNEKEL